MSIKGLRQRDVIMMPADAEAFVARLKARFPDMRVVLKGPYHLASDGTCWAGRHPDLHVPYADRFDHRDGVPGVNEGYMGWLEPPGWQPEWRCWTNPGPPNPDNPFARSYVGISNHPRFSFRFHVTSARKMAKTPRFSRRPLLAHHAADDRAKRSFVDAVWRIWGKGATNLSIRGTGFVGLPEDPPEMREGAEKIPIFAGFHAVRYAREIGLAAKI